MEARALVTKAILTSAKLAEVTSRSRYNVIEELEDDAAGVLVVDRDVKLYE